MDLSQEFIEQNGLSAEQVTAITGHATTHIQELKGSWDGKANKDAEAILDGAAKKIQDITGVSRDQGEKVADFMNRSWNQFSEKGTSDIEAKKIELAEKIKNASGNEFLSKEFDELQVKYSGLQKKEASFDELINSGVTDKYNTLLSETNKLKISNAFGGVKPSFPNEANQYEVSAKWDSFKNSILKDNTLEMVDNEWYAVDKENKHKTTKLSDLVSKDADLIKLLEGRQQNGLGGKETSLLDVEGVPFKVPANSSSSERAKLIRDHLTSQGISQTSNNYSKKFAELNKLILSKAI